MKKRLICLALPLIVGSVSCGPSSIPGMEKENIEVTMNSHFEDTFPLWEFKDTALYNDYWFLEDSATTNYELAVLSAMATGASSSNKTDPAGWKATLLLDKAGFTNIERNDYYARGVTLQDSMGVIIGEKKIKNWEGKEYTLLAIFPRSEGYDHEWAGNFNLGTEGFHAGFLAARDEVLRFTKHYINAQNLAGDLKVWCAGYSRGGATANLFGGFLAEDSGYFGSDVKIAPKDIFVYTIGTPFSVPATFSKSAALSVSGPRGDEYALDTDVPAYTFSGTDASLSADLPQYAGIHNFTAVGDYVTKLPPKQWGFTRYGVTEQPVYGDEAMLKYLDKLSPDTADMLRDRGTYADESPVKTFDLEKFMMVNGKEKISPDALIEDRLTAAMSLAGDRKGLVEGGYADLLGAAACIWDIDPNGFNDGIKDDIGGAIKTALLNYLAYATDALGVEDAVGATRVVTDLIKLMGKEVSDPTAYTDQKFLADVLDYLINDYQSSETAVSRAKVIASLIPAPYGTLYTGVLNYAKEKALVARTADQLLYLLASYMRDNKEDETVASIIGQLAGLIPTAYIGFITAITHKPYDEETYPDPVERGKAAVSDLLDCFVIGTYDGETLSVPADANRQMILTLAMALLPNPSPNLQNLVMNGTKDASGTETVNDTAPLNLVIDEILKFILPKDEKGNFLSLKDAADQTLTELILKGKTEKNGVYVDKLAANPKGVRDIIFTVLFKPGEEYSLASDIANAVTFIDGITFLFPSHYHEMYLCYLKTKLPAEKK